MRKSHYLKLLVLLVALFTTTFAPVNMIESHAQPPCYYRADWPIYIVRYGDTLSKIAQRYRTTAWTLTSANCLNNPNYVYVGQRLRVPPGTPPPPPTQPQPQPGYYIPITYQTFEGGLMLFRADNGDIWVFGGNGLYYRSFPAYVYGGLPDNPVRDNPPTWRLKPIMGFGKVWGNYPEVRNMLGWGTESERSWNMFYQPEAYPNLFTVTLAGNNRIRVFRNTYGINNWLYVQGGPPPTPIPVTPTFTPVPGPIQVGASYQLFENGLMIWRGDTGTIYVLVNDGRFYEFSLSQYGNLPDNPVQARTPINRVRPQFGFGRVWGNNWYIRLAVGWGVSSEQGYTSTLKQPSPSTLSVSLPDKREVALDRSVQTWKFTDGTLPPLSQVTISEDGSDGTIPTTEPLPTSEPLPTTTPQPTTTLLVQTQAAFQTFQNGFMIWRADTSEIWVFYGNGAGKLVRYSSVSYEGLPDNPVTDAAPDGLSSPVSGFGKVWGNFPDVRAGLGWGTAPEMGYTMNVEQIGVSSDGPILKMTIPSGAAITVNADNWNL
ncbi:MAG: LysM peptidoglycan-binding domain-containing protein [Anaerolineae bacterium]|nr:LysM peptidoglycan-binding domain-containing protein [Anaerolineae bacterium]